MELPPYTSTLSEHTSRGLLQLEWKQKVEKEAKNGTMETTMKMLKKYMYEVFVMVYNNTSSSIMSRMDNLYMGQPMVSDKGFTETFEINHLDKEYLVSVEGYYDEADCGVIQGIQFKTNLKTSELMGDDKGRKFSLAAYGNKIIRFHGYAEKNLNSLGAYFTTSSSNITKLEPRGTTYSGTPWDDGSFVGVRKVNLFYDNNYVRCVKFDYEYRGKVEKREHGILHGQEGEVIIPTTLNIRRLVCV
ncbi:Jacalin-related lectin 17 [Cardamine amara subsp. amara]|uniref:Jacalin-related lectin 17 n=1 Tax=Cardamine amara subsp. amara TaxID=228776 RepID=A0ABD0ZBK5_CARAN